MPYYFMRDTPLQALEQLMMSQPGQKPRGGGIYRSPFRYTPEDVACEYCQNYVRKHPCRLCECTCLEERIEAGVLELNAFMRDCFTPSMGPQFRKGCISNLERGNLNSSNSSCPMPTGEDGHTGGNAAGVCPTGTKRPSSCSQHTRVFGAGWSGNAGMTALTSKASGSEESSRSYTASTRRRRPLRSAAVISLSQTLRLRNWSQMRRST